MVETVPKDATVEGVSREVVTSEGPRSNISSGEVAQPYQEMGKAFDKLSAGLEDVAIPLAQRAAAEDLNKQRVTRDADGSIQVLNPANSVIFGEAGRDYERAVAAGTVAQTGNAVSSLLTDLHTKYPLDPAGFKAAAQPALAKLYSTAPNPIIGEAMQRDGDQAFTHHNDAIVNATAMNQVENEKKSILANIDDQKNTLIGLARAPGGASTQEFKDAVVKLNDAYDNLGSNKLFKTPQDQIDLEKKNTAALLQGEGVVAHVDETFNKKTKAAAQAELEREVLGNPNMREADRTRLYAQGMARLQFLSADVKAGFDANKGIREELETNLANGKIRVDDPAIGMAIAHLQSTGDVENLNRLRAAVQVAPHLGAVSSLPSGSQAAALGVSKEDMTYETEAAAVAAGARAWNPTTKRALFDAPTNAPSVSTPDLARDRSEGAADIARRERAPGAVSVPLTGGTQLSDVQRAVLGQESGNRDNPPPAGKGAVGPGQILPGTFAEFAKPGENIDNPADNRAVSGRIIAHYFQLYDGDAARVAVAYFSGEGNVAPAGSPTPWLRDSNDGKPTVSAYVAQVAGRLGGAAPRTAPSADGGPPFTQAQADANPFLLSAYFRTLAADPESRMEAIKGTAEAIGKSIDAGVIPPPHDVAMVVQAGERDPAKFGFIAAGVQGRMLAESAADLSAPQREAYAAAIRTAANGADIYHQTIATSALAQMKQQDERAKADPYGSATQRFGADKVPAAPPIDPAQTDAIAPALAQRATLSQRIGALDRSDPPPLIDRANEQQLRSALQGPDGAKVLGQIAGLEPKVLDRLTDEAAFRESVLGMARSGDPVKMNAAFGLMDKLVQANPLKFDAQFKDGLRDLRAWQANLAFYPPDEAAKRIMAQYDPAQTAALEESKKVADRALESVSADQVVTKFSTGLPIVGAGFGLTGTAAQAPVGLAVGALRADYAKNYRDGFAASGDATMADKFAVEKLGLKYAVSPVNGNRVTPWAPERYSPDVGGSKNWMTDQLNRDIAAKVGAPFLDEMTGAERLKLSDVQVEAVRKAAAPHVLMPDAQTEAEIAAHKQPSYPIVLQDPNGRWSALMEPNGAPSRFRFDPAKYQADLAGRAEALRARSVLPAAAPDMFIGKSAQELMDAEH